MTGAYLPAGVRGLPLQYVLRERWRLQLVLVKGHLVYHHGLRVQTGETNMGVGWTWRLHGTQNGTGNTVTAHVASQTTFCNLLLIGINMNMLNTQTTFCLHWQFYDMKMYKGNIVNYTEYCQILDVLLPLHIASIIPFYYFCYFPFLLNY